ncbi:MAG: 30S ribosomal protein S9 [Vampirovibrionales bacterium]|nr:30S ribosomal protein S9 [Vampirovibrionales bacterium]
MAERKAQYPQVGVRGTGRRKEAVARVRVKPGSGRVLINGRLMEEYLGFRKALQAPVMQPLVAAGVESRYDVLADVYGGGKAGQADAVRMGLARALSAINPDYETIMRSEGFMTRDARSKERKKYGLHRARKACQYSKR